MPRCVCPHCFHVHAIPVKNLGLKGRCKSCREVFLLVAEPEPVPPPIPPVMPQPVPPPVPEAYHLPPIAAVEPEQDWGATFAAEAAAPVGDEEEFSFGAPDLSSPGRKRRGTVDDLPSRPALLTIADVCRMLAYLLFVGAGIVALITIYAVVYQVRSFHGRQLYMQLMTLFGVVIPTIIGLIVLGTVLLAIREVIAWMVALEARQYEISKNLARW